MISDMRCILCSNADENIPHIFSACTYSSAVLDDPDMHLTKDWVSYCSGNFVLGNHSRLSTCISYLFLAVSVFYLWQERNLRIHNLGHVRTVGQLKSLIKRMMREKLISNVTFQKAAAKNPNLISSLY